MVGVCRTGARGCPTDDHNGGVARTRPPALNRYRPEAILVTAVILIAAASTPSVAAASSPGAGAAVLSPEALPAPATYTVQAGDTLSAVAARLGVPSGQIDDWVAAVVSLNRLTSPDEIAPGEVLNLPGPATSVRSAPSTGDSYVVL